MTSVAVDSEEGGVVCACARERAGEAPQVIVSLAAHGIAMQGALTPGNAAALGAALVRIAAELQMSEILATNQEEEG